MAIASGTTHTHCVLHLIVTTDRPGATQTVLATDHLTNEPVEDGLLGTSAELPR